MSLMKIVTWLLVSAVVACILFVIIALASPTTEPGAALNGWQVLGALSLIYWLGAAIAAAIILLVNFRNSRRNAGSSLDIWPFSRRVSDLPPMSPDRPADHAGSRRGLETADSTRVRILSHQRILQQVWCPEQAWSKSLQLL